MNTPREPHADSWKPLILSTNCLSFWENSATSSHECALIRGKAACGGNGSGSSTQPKGISSRSRLRWAPRSDLSHIFFIAGDQNSASQSLSSRCGLKGGVTLISPFADFSASCRKNGMDSQSNSSKKR